MDKNDFLGIEKYPPIVNGHKVKSFVTNPYHLRSAEILILERCIGLLKLIDTEYIKMKKGLETFLDDGGFTIGPLDELSDKIVDFLCEYFQIDTDKPQNPIWEYVYDNSLGEDGDIHTMEELLDAIISFNDPECITETAYKSATEVIERLVKSQQDLPPGINDIVNDNFWKLVDEDELQKPKHCKNCRYFKPYKNSNYYSCIADEDEILTMFLDERSGTTCEFFKHRWFVPND